MKIESLGHVVIKVRNQKKSEDFYHGLLGLPICARYDDMKMTFYSLGDHHDFATIAMGDDAESAPQRAPGLFHVAFKVGDNLDALREAKRHLEGAGVRVAAVDHEVTQSLYFSDPDGNTVEVYVDTSDAWRREPQRVAGAKPLTL
jgi:catechol 2,3-dioxygenase